MTYRSSLLFFSSFIFFLCFVLIAHAQEPVSVTPPDQGELAQPSSDSVEIMSGESGVNVNESGEMRVETIDPQLLNPGSTAQSPADDLVVSDDEVFFDADSLVPEGELARNSGPRKVDPRLEPGSKFVVVRRNHEGSSEQARLVSAQRAIDLGRYDSALEILDRLYMENKDDPNVLLGRAVALHKLGRFDEAVLAYEAVLEGNPDNLEAQINMLGLMGTRFPSVALQRMKSLYEDNSSNPKLVAQIAVLLGRIGNYEEALRYLGVAASIEPKNPMHFYNMAVIADTSEDTEKAIEYYEEALELDTVHGGGRSIPRKAVFSRLSDLR